MQQITSTIGLKEAIRQLEIQSDVEAKELKKDIQDALKSLNPFNILRGTLDKTASTPPLLDNLFGTVLGLVVGYLTKKIVVGKSGNKLRVMLGSVVQYGILNLVAQRLDTIKTIGRYLLNYFLKKRTFNRTN